MGFTPREGKELLIHNLGRMDSFGLGAIHISDIIWDCFVINGGLGGLGKLGAISLLITFLVHDEAQKNVDSLLHIIRKRKEDIGKLLTHTREISVGGLPRNGVK